MKKALAFLVIAPLMAVIMSGFYANYLFTSAYKGPTKEFTIDRGEAFSSINYRLKKDDLISSSRIFHYYSKYTDSMTTFRPGTYEIKAGMKIRDIINSFQKGPINLVDITIPEGKNLYEIANIVEQGGVCKSKNFIELAKDREFIQSLDIPGPNVEGYLYPETYKFNKNIGCSVVIKTMVSIFRQKTSNIDFTVSNLSPHEVVILASIVEKETGAGHERPIIAGVFLNRLKKRMRLQSDPTTIYGIYENFDGNLRKKHLLEKTPYNTYKIPALPIGPISNPGIEAINAVLSPEKHNYLYFVSKNDGTHIFTKNYKDHLKAVKTWQQTRKNRVGKSWRDLNKDEKDI